MESVLLCTEATGRFSGNTLKNDLQLLLKKGYSYFICRLQNVWGIYRIEQLKQYKKQGYAVRLMVLDCAPLYP